MQNFRESRNKNLGTQIWKTSSKKISIALLLSPSYNKTINSSNKNLNFLSELISTGKEKQLISHKHLLKNKESSDILYKKVNIKLNFAEKNLKNKKTINKLRNVNIIVKCDNIKKLKLNDIKGNLKFRNNKLPHFKTERSYLDNVKNDDKELSKKK